MIVALLSMSAFGQSVAWPNVSALLSRNVDWEHQGQYLGSEQCGWCGGPACGSVDRCADVFEHRRRCAVLLGRIDGPAGDLLRVVRRHAQKSHLVYAPGRRA